MFEQVADFNIFRILWTFCNFSWHKKNLRITAKKQKDALLHSLFVEFHGNQAVCSSLRIVELF